MRRHLFRGTLLSILALSLPSIGATEIPKIPPEIPTKGTERDRGKPVWVEAGRAVVQGGLQTDMFSSMALSHLRWAMRPAKKQAGPAPPRPKGAPSHPPEANEALCETWISTPNEWAVSDFSLEALLEHSELAFLGTVVDVQEGFLYGFEALLFAVSVGEVLQSQRPGGEVEPGSTIYVSYPYASIRIGDQMLCRRGPRYPERPAVGRRILVFAGEVLDREPWVVKPADDELFFESGEGTVVFPAHVGEFLDPPQWDDFVGDQGQNLASNLVDR